MKIKTFQARTMQEALKSIKDKLGPDAVILSSKQVRGDHRFLGLFGPTMVEVTAAVDIGQRNTDRQALRQPDPPAAAAREGGGELQDIREELRTLRRLLEASAVVGARREKPGDGQGGTAALHQRLVAPYHDLVRTGLDPDTARHLVTKAQEQAGPDDLASEAAIRQMLHRSLARQVRASGPLLRRDESKKTVIFVGPTGVGKTTTIAKLAARYTLDERRLVSLITLDTYRVAAVEQLRMYARLIGISMDVALTKREALEWIRRRDKAELILVDTAGRSPMDEAGIEELRQLVTLDHPVETHLVLSATTRERDLTEIMARFAGIPITRLLFTKLDETTGIGGVFDTMHRTGLPLSYFSIGQSVPADLELVRPERLADLMLGGALRPGQVQAA